MNHSHLTEGVAIASTEEALKAIYEYQRTVAKAGQSVDDEVVWRAVECLALEPAANETLHPLNWRIRKPRLDIIATITPMRHFCVFVSPWRESLGNALRAGNAVRDGDDFITFPFLAEAPGYPRLRFLDLPLGDVGRYPNQLSGSAELDGRLALQRRIVGCIYEHTVKRLAALFECRMREILVSFGDQNFLETRRVGADGETAERADLITYDEARWHPMLQPLCKQFGVEVDKILVFYREHLAQLEHEQRQRKMLEDYLGKGGYYRSRREKNKVLDTTGLLKVLCVACDPATYPPLVAGESERFQSVLASTASETPEGKWVLLAQSYGIDKDQVIDLMRAMDPSAFAELSHGGAALKVEIDFLAATDMLGSARHAQYDERLQKALAATLERAKREGQQQASDKRLLAQCAGVRSYTALQSWAAANAPQTAAWLKDVTQPLKKPKTTAGSDLTCEK